LWLLVRGAIILQGSDLLLLHHSVNQGLLTLQRAGVYLQWGTKLFQQVSSVRRDSQFRQEVREGALFDAKGHRITIRGVDLHYRHRCSVRFEGADLAYNGVNACM
jgi:hypothetical protein